MLLMIMMLMMRMLMLMLFGATIVASDKGFMKISKSRPIMMHHNVKSSCQS